MRVTVPKQSDNKVKATLRKASKAGLVRFKVGCCDTSHLNNTHRLDSQTKFANLMIKLEM